MLDSSKCHTASSLLFPMCRKSGFILDQNVYWDAPVRPSVRLSVAENYVNRLKLAAM